MYAFAEIFDKSEVPYVEAFQSSNLSYVCTARTGTVQGFILVRLTPEGATNYEIAFLGMTARYRGKGYASRLIEIVKDAAAAAAAGLWLVVLDSNKEALALYNKQGFDAFEKFISHDGEPATKFTFGVEYQCHHCRKTLKPNDTRWENTPTSIVLTPYGLQQILEIKPVCWHCRTKCEP
jgi:GNAT superfamily N-acetyltransferase